MRFWDQRHGTAHRTRSGQESRTLPGGVTAGEVPCGSLSLMNKALPSQGLGLPVLI